MTGFRRPIFLILLLALALRLAYGLPQARLELYQRESGGDSWWYLEYGRLLVTGQEPASPPSGPLYLLWVGFPQHFFPPDAAITFIRLLQSLIATVTCGLVYHLAWTVSGNQHCGLLAAGVLAISPAFVIESFQITTETLYLFLLVAGLWLYVVQITVQRDNHPPRRPYFMIALVGLLFGLATLTRAVLLAFPLGIAIHLVMTSGWRAGLKRAAVLVTVYALVISTWTIYNKVKWNQWVVGAQGFAAFLYLGASDAGWQGPELVDASLGITTQGNSPTDPNAQQQVYQNNALQAITSDLAGWLSLRAGKLTAAYLQPHGTIFFGGESLKDLAINWFANDRSVAGLLRLAEGDAFWAKLAVYGFHFVGILAGLAGLWLTRRNWRLTLPLAGFLLYTSIVHFILDAIPRYLFPVDLVLWIFASAALVAFWQRAHLLYRRPSAVEERIGIAENMPQL